MCFVWTLEETAIISLYVINLLVAITETKCVYCAVRAGSMCITDITPSKPIGYYMYSQFNIQQLYVLPTLYLCVLYGS